MSYGQPCTCSLSSHDGRTLEAVACESDDGPCQQNAARRQRRQEEKGEPAVVQLRNAAPDEDAVVIEVRHTMVACLAVVAVWWPPDVARCAVAVPAAAVCRHGASAAAFGGIALRSCARVQLRQVEALLLPLQPCTSVPDVKRVQCR